MKIGLDLEMKATFEYSISKYVLISIQMSRFVFIRDVCIWFGFTCQQEAPPPRYLSRCCDSFGTCGAARALPEAHHETND